MCKRAGRSFRESLHGLVIVIAAALAGPVVAGGVPVGAIEQSRLGAIGRVNIPGYNIRSACTGTLIAPDLVLTAAHCVLRLRSRVPAPAEEIIFAAGYRQGTAMADARGKSVRIHRGFVGEAQADARYILSDMALITLARPLDIAPMRLATSTDHSVVTLYGYRADRPHILSKQEDCRPVIQRVDVLGLDCATVPGTSGGPVVAMTEDGPRVVGVVSAGVNGSEARTLAPAPLPWLLEIGLD